MASPDPAVSKKAPDWTYGGLVGLLVYALSVGPVHGLYYTDKLSDKTWEVMQWVYCPINWVERQLPDGEPIHTYKYWWYIGIKYHRLPGMGSP